MTHKLFRTTAIVLMLALGAPALAQTVDVSTHASVQTGGANASVTAGAQGSAEATAKARADQEIDRRVSSLNAFLGRINGMTKIDATFKASLASTIQTQINDLTTLKSTIDADTTASTLKVEVQSITKSYRIYALVLPQAAIGAAADRAQTLVGMFTTLGGKLSARIASSSGDTSAAAAALVDFNAKVADAQVQATAAVNHIAGLEPDNGNKTVMQTNDTALKLARADVRVAQQDFVAARKDADTIIQSLGGTSSASVNGSVQTQ